MTTYTPKRTLTRIVHLIERNGPIKPNNANIIDKMDIVANELLGELGITRDHETFRRCNVQIQDGQSEYVISQSGFSQPWLAETWDDGADPYFIPQEITITPIQNRERLIFASPGIPEIQATNAGTVLSFFTESGQSKMAVMPPPRSSWMVRIYFTATAVALGLNDLALPLQDRFNGLLAIETALLSLASTGHDDATFSRLERGLMRQQSTERRLFEIERLQQSSASDDRSYFGADRDEAGYLY